MTSTLVSCICSTYNRPTWLRRAVELFLAQSYESKELIVVDVGDKNIEPIDDPRIKWIPVKQRISYEQACFIGFEAAQGSYLTYFDDDDYHGPNRLMAQVIPLLQGMAHFTGFEAPLLFLPEMAFKRWTREQIAKWAAEGGDWLPFQDGTGMWNRAFIMPTEAIQAVKFYEHAYKSGAILRNVINHGDFLYVRHPGAQWKFDASTMCEAIFRPDWVTTEMMKWWANKAMLLEGPR